MPREKTTHTKPKMIHIRLSDELHQQLRIQVAKENQTIQDWVEQLRVLVNSCVNSFFKQRP
jgi:predicted HicB family RNase H-like nuclease